MLDTKKLTLILLLISFTGCKDFASFQSDPNQTTEATPGLLLTNLEVAAFNKISLSSALANQYLVFTETASSSQYYSWQRSGFGDYSNLRQVMTMREEAKQAGKANYEALAKFFEAYFIVQLTQTFGDVPYSEAMQGSQGQFTPVYDRQRDIYLAVLNTLKQASQELSPDGGLITGDLVYEGDILKWKKLINSFSLRILISLSHKTGDSELKVIERFREIVENPDKYPVMESNADNAALSFYDLEGNRYPYYNDNSIQTNYYLEQSFVERLQNRQDPRLFIFGIPKPNADDLQDDDYDAYGGLRASASLDVNQQRAVNGEASRIHPRYYDNPINEPSIALGYAEVQFILAEAAVRGWISQSPDQFYLNGIRASMSFYEIEEEAINIYLNSFEVQLNGSNVLEQILTEKHTAFFMNSGWEPFFNQLRTGLPKYDTSGEGMLNNGKIPKRWMYPEQEFQYNQEHVDEAVKRQYPNGDTINGVMWLLKDE